MLGNQSLTKYQPSVPIEPNEQPPFTSTTTKHIQNVHVVIVTSHDQNLELEQQRQSQQRSTWQRHLSSSEGSSSVPVRGILGCGHNSPLCESSGSCSSSDESPGRYHAGRCHCEHHGSVLEKPAGNLPPDEEREQAEGAEDENPVARAPFAQLPGVGPKPDDKN